MAPTPLAGGVPELSPPGPAAGAHRAEFRPDDAMKFRHRMVALMETDGVTAAVRPAIGATVRWLDEPMNEEETLWHEPIELPNGKILTVSEVVEGLHLQSFVEVEVDRNDTALDAEGENR